MTLLQEINKQFGNWDSFYEIHESFIRQKFSETTRSPKTGDAYDTALAEGYIRCCSQDPDVSMEIHEQFARMVIGGHNAERSRENRHRFRQTSRDELNYHTADVHQVRSYHAKIEELEAKLNPTEYKVAMYFFVHEWTRTQIAKELNIDSRKVSSIISHVKKIA